MSESRVVLVSGGLGFLGQAVALRFLREGHLVCVQHRSPARIGELRQRAEQTGASGQLHDFVCEDWSDPVQVGQCVGEINGRFDRVDVLANCVGLTRRAPLLRLEPDLWSAMFRGNVDPVYHSMRAVLPGMLARGWGRVINVTSWKAERGEAEMAAYSAVKSAVNRLTETAAAELPFDAGLDVTVNAVLPAKLNTQRNRDLMPEEDPRRWIQLDDVAALIAFLASDHGRAINGACLPLHGHLFGHESHAPLRSGGA